MKCLKAAATLGSRGLHLALFLPVPCTENLPLKPAIGETAEITIEH